MSLSLKIKLMNMAARVVLCAALFGCVAESRGAITGTVTTIGGNYYTGFVNGGNDVSLFSDPRGLAVDSLNQLFVADFGNNAVRKLNPSTEVTSTFLVKTNLSGPIALAFDQQGNLLVVNALARNVVKFNRDGVFQKVFANLIADPTGIAIDIGGNVYVSMLTNKVQRFSAAGAASGSFTLARANAQLWGVTLTPDNGLVVSDSANSVLWKFPLLGGSETLFAGTIGVAGFADGAPGVAEFNAPRELATTTNGIVVLADFFNHRVRGVNAEGLVQTLYGVDPASWSNTPAQFLPGWTDGAAAEAELRQPFGIAVDANNTVYDSETSKYAVIRKVTGLTLPTNTVALASLTPVLTPSSGFFPGAVTIQVTSSNDPTAGFGPNTRIYYTLDGSDPGPANPGSGQAILSEGKGIISLTGPLDLSTLEVRVFNDTVAGPIIFGGTTAVGRPSFTPNAGIFPGGVRIIVTNELTTSGFFATGTRLFYTTNSTEPTLASFEAPVANGIGVIDIAGPVDLANLAVKAFIGLTSSETVKGTTLGFDLPGIFPTYGYYPGGARILVTNANSPSGVFAPTTTIRYTADGTEPTATSAVLPLTGGMGNLLWRSSTLDLTSLRVKAFGPTNNSVSITGTAFTSDLFDGEVGVALGRTNFVGGNGQTNALYFGGPGARVVLPIIANMAPGKPLRSVSFVLEVISPQDAIDTTQRIDPPSLPRIELMSTNDFIPITIATTNSPVDIAPVTTSFNVNANVSLNRLPIAYLTTNGFTVDRFSMVAIISIPIPLKAKIGSQYTVRVRNLTGRGDNGLLRIRTNYDAVIQVKSIPYMVGDTSPHLWYNAGDFGDRYASSDVETTDKPLDNADVSDAFFASLHTFVKPPYTSSDLFDAMDSAPEDSPGVVGGDTKIGFLDWNITLLRALGINQNNWRRYKTNDFPRNEQIFQNELFGSPLDVADGLIAKTSPWDKAATLEAGTLQNVTQGGTARVPIYAHTRAGKSIGAMQFAAIIESEDGDTAINGVTFVPAAGIPAPDLSGSDFSAGAVNNAFYAAWTLNRLSVSGNVLLGYAQFVMPLSSFTGHSYTIRFSGQEGVSLRTSSGGYDAYDFDSIRAKIWVNSLAKESAFRFADEWKLFFFGTLNEAPGFADEDSDHDGFSNFAEFKGGLNPLQADWRVRVTDTQIHVRWFASSGKRYSLDRGVDLNSWSNGLLDMNGDDAVHEFQEPVSGAKTFYRIRSSAP
jgi:hypothetical protein